jgi:polyisoprenoid-binding protein YceI
MTVRAACPLSVILAVTLSALPTRARAQGAWTVDPKLSLAWWQMSPHFASLWGTTCPEDPGWQAGEGGSSEWHATSVRRQRGYPEKPDTVNVPLYPRRDVQPICRAAVTGHLARADTTKWTGIHGDVTVDMDSLEMGSRMRNGFAYSTVFETGRYATTRYRIDSLVNVTLQGDTLLGTAVGVITIRGVDTTLTAAMRAWPQNGGMRVLAKLHIPAAALEEQFGVSRLALSLGVGANLWNDLFMGVDLLLHPAAAGN